LDRVGLVQPVGSGKPTKNVRIFGGL